MICSSPVVNAETRNSERKAETPNSKLVQGGRAGLGSVSRALAEAKISYAIKRTKTGLGFFATEPIPKGTRIVEYTGPIVPNEEVEKSYGKYFFGINSKSSIDGSPRSNVARYINHSCRPNAEAVISGRRVWIWSKRNIKPGEEVTYDYGDEYFDNVIKPIGCKCEKCQ
jgi:SET domain-containing protein